MCGVNVRIYLQLSVIPHTASTFSNTHECHCPLQPLTLKTWGHYQIRWQLPAYQGVLLYAWTKCGIWESHFREILLLEGNLCNFEEKFIILMDILVFFFQKILKIWPYSRDISHFFQPWMSYCYGYCTKSVGYKWELGLKDWPHF